jgi:4-hydroxyphenylacetate 3-hydroxylase, reductase component
MQSTSPIDSLQLRRATGQFATGVTIVTCHDEQAGHQGMTANSFTSVSLDPPLVLWSVGKSARSSAYFKTCSHFAIHILTQQQGILSNQFAKAGTDKFMNAEYGVNEYGVPVLGDCLVVLECSQYACHDAGDHWIIVGLVNKIREHQDPAIKPLVFQRGRYCALMHDSDSLTTLEQGKAWMGMEPASWS